MKNLGSITGGADYPLSALKRLWKRDLTKSQNLKLWKKIAVNMVYKVCFQWILSHLAIIVLNFFIPAKGKKNLAQCT